MMSTDISLREKYVNTLFELARESQAVTAVKEDLQIIAGIVEEENDLVRFLKSPYFSRQCKQQLITTALSERISELTMNFLMVLIQHNRAGLLEEIIFGYGRLWDTEHNCYPVKVTVSRPLEQGEAEELKTAIEQAVGGTIRLKLAVDPDILGGAVIRCGDKVIDNSAYHRLQTAVKTIISQIKGRNQ
jgi:F-type H+-transporting ATPase subunit delta